MKHIGVIADNGFSDALEIKACVDNGITPYVAQRESNGGRRNVPRGFTIDKFTYDKDTDMYMCPGGQRLEFYLSEVAHGKEIRIYKSKTDACFSCPFYMIKCTKNKVGRWVWRWAHQEVIDEMKDRLRKDPGIMDKRKAIVEHPFGTMKRAFNQPYLLLRGLRKVGGEVGFTMIAYNMRRALNILGPIVMMQAIRCS